MVDFYRFNLTLNNGLNMFFLDEQQFWKLNVKRPRAKACFSSKSVWETIMEFLGPHKTCRSGIAILLPVVFDFGRAGGAGKVSADRGRDRPGSMQRDWNRFELPHMTCGRLSQLPVQ